MAGVGLVILAVIAAGFVAERIFGPGADPMGEATEAIEGLPYRVSVREASEGVLVGTARGHHGAVVHFAISEGEADRPQDIPPRLLHLDKNVMGGGGFTVWEDSEAPHDGESAAEWDERGRVALDIEEALCRQETGEACPI
ncbi:MAG TPA: hypothetical protein VJL81_00100 [Solirubrobacterales bacterium]|nr:hypothetical protein [Solirubrobacterales bacterium]